MSTIIFHYLHPLADKPKSGSELRPVRMLEAFRQTGVEVIPIVGTSDQRKPAIANVLNDIDRGRTIDAIYSECVTTPTMLSDPGHRPTQPLLEPSFFRTLGKAGVRRGLFYRDVYWRFPIYRDNLPLWKRTPAIAAYHADLAWYRRYLDVVFLPSLMMAKAVPGAERFPATVALPPGSEWQPSTAAASNDDTAQDVATQNEAPSDQLRVLYVGAARPPLYDITHLLDAVRNTPQLRLRVCCPEADGDWVRSTAGYATGRVELHHIGADELPPHYAWAEIASVSFAPHDYRDFAMPLKLFEAIGAGLPIVASAPSSVAQLVEDESLGWTHTGVNTLTPLLKRLATNRDEIERVTTTVEEASERHTWEARAITALEALGLTIAPS